MCVMTTSASPEEAVPPPAELVTFLSTGGGAACTSVAANVALLVAQAQRRILVLDWNTDRPHVQEYLQSFEIGSQPPPDELAKTARSVLGLTAEDTLSLRSYALPGAKLDGLDLITVDSGTRQQPFPVAEESFRTAVAQLRKLLQAQGYQHVFIVLPNDSTPQTATTVALLCDVAVVCFQAWNRLIHQAGELGRKITEETPSATAIVPVVTSLDGQVPTMAARARDAIQSMFGTQAFEIPRSRYEGLVPLLVTLAEERDGTTEYERLAMTVAQGAVEAIPPIPAALRLRYRRAFDPDEGTSDRLVIAGAPRHRPWAEWVRGRLAAAGAEPVYLADVPGCLAEPGPVDTVVIGSPDDDGYPAAEIERIRAGDGVVVHLLVDDQPDEPVTDVSTTERTILVADLTAEQVANQLLAAFGLIGWPMTENGGEGKYPRGPRAQLPWIAVRPKVTAGRDVELLELRKLLQNKENRTPIAVAGPPGVGKSVFAAEYAARFAHDYDAVWWVTAHDRQATLTSLFWLFGRLRNTSTGVDANDPLMDVVNTAARGQRLLLVYDNADDIPAVVDLIPTGGRADILVTTNQSDAFDRTITLGPLAEQDSVRLLQRRIRGLPNAEATAVARLTGNLPVTLDVTVRLLREDISRLRDQGVVLTDAMVAVAREFIAEMSPGPVDVTTVVRLIKRRLAAREDGELVIAVAELCAFLSPLGVSLDVLRSPTTLARLSSIVEDAPPMLATDVVEIDRVLWIGARSGLFHVGWGESPVLWLHRQVQASLIAAMNEEHRRARNTHVLRILAAYAPMEMDRSDNAKNRHNELQRHVQPSQAIRSEEDTVRRWLVNQLRFLYVVGNVDIWRAAIEPAEEALAHWATFAGPDVLRGQLATQLANIHRRLGQNDQARRLDIEAVDDLRRIHREHPRAWIAARGLGGDLRGLGLFAEALVEDQKTLAGLKATLGADHPHTRSAANNLALTEYLSGNTQEALDLEEDNFKRRMRLFGPKHLATWYSLCNIGMYLRELGEYDKATEALKTAWLETMDLTSAQNIRNSPEELRIKWQYAITERRKGDSSAAKQHNAEAAAGYRQRAGSDHPDTVACELSLSVAYRMARDTEHGLRKATECVRQLRGLTAITEDHPFVWLGELTLGLHLRACNRHEEALEVLDIAAAGLARKLTTNHPWALAATVNQATQLAICDRTDEAVTALERTIETFRDHLDPKHPYVTCAVHNLDVAKRRRAGTPTAADVWRDIDIDIPQT